MVQCLGHRRLSQSVEDPKPKTNGFFLFTEAFKRVSAFNTDLDVCEASSNNKLLGTSASLLVTSALLVVTRS